MPIEQKTGQQQSQGGEGGENTGAAAPQMTEEMKKFIADQVTGAASRVRGMTAKEVEALKSDMVAIREQLERFAKPHDEPVPPGAKGADDQIRALEAKHEKTTKALAAQLEAERKAREDEKSARMRQEERTALSQVLTEAGVAPESLGMVLAYLYTETGRVTRDDKGAICFKGTSQYGGEELLSLKDGVAQWIKTEGKHCLATRDVAGAGTSPGKAPSRQQRTQQGPISMHDAGVQLLDAMGYTKAP